MMTSRQRIQSTRYLPLAGTCALVLLVAYGRPARAQYIETYFPAGVPGYDTAQGVTVLSRLRPEYQAPGIQVGSFTVRPHLDEAIGYDSDPNGTNRGGSSAFVRTSPSVSASSDWSRNALGASVTADSYQYFSQPSQNYTNWTASIGGGYTIGRSNLTLGYSHLSLNQNPTEVGAVQSDSPIHYDVNDVRSDYTFYFGRFSVTPNIDFQTYTYNNAVVLGQTVSQAYRDRNVLLGGATLRYSLSDQRSVVAVLEGVNSNFTQPEAGQPSNDSTSVLALAGLDYQAEGPWRYRVLGGLEERSFSASQYKTHIAPIVLGQAIWTPTGLTTVTGSIARTIESPAASGSSGYTYSIAQLGVDHELFRNIILQARAGFQLAQYLQGGGNQTSYTLGAGASWLLNRNVRLSLNYAFSDTSSSNATTFNGVPNITTTNSSQSTRNVAFLALHLGL
jgi:hypothetical protein